MATTQQTRLYHAIKSKIESDLNEALFSLDLFFSHPTAIGDHTSKTIVKDVEKALNKLSEAQGKLETLEFYYHNNSLIKHKSQIKTEGFDDEEIELKKQIYNQASSIERITKHEDGSTTKKTLK